jgi:hypothetical protein
MIMRRRGEPNMKDLRFAQILVWILILVAALLAAKYDILF